MGEAHSLAMLRDQHAEPVLAGIREAAEAAPAEIGEVLAFVAANLFERDLLGVVRKHFADRPDSLLERAFPAVLGQPLGTYARDRRMEVAGALLVRTDLPGAAVGGLVGYESRSAFHAAFKAWPGSGSSTPAKWRRKARAALAEQEPRQVAAEEPAVLPEVWRAALFAAWPDFSAAEEADEGAKTDLPGLPLIAQLISSYPSVADRCRRLLGEVPNGAVVAPEDCPDTLARLVYEGFKAGRVLDVLESEPSPLVSACLKSVVPMRSFVLVDALQRAGSPEDALASLAVCESPAAEVLAAFRAEAAVRVALSALQQNDLARAERELGAAEVELEAAGQAAVPTTQATLEATRAAHLLRQGRYPEAAAAAHAAAEGYRRLGDEAASADCILLREEAHGASVLADAIPDLEAALEAVDETTQPDLALRLLASLTASYGRAGRNEEARAALERMARIHPAKPGSD